MPHDSVDSASVQSDHCTRCNDELQALADACRKQIADGRLRPGDRLPPQRDFADTHRIAPSTAIRVYAELTRRGLVVGEVGRGTFVRTGPPLDGFSLAQGIGGLINLATNVPLLPNQAARLMASASRMTRRTSVMAAAMDTVLARGTAAARRTVASFLARARWHPNPDGVVFTGNGRQALAATLAALVPPGQRLGVEALSYQSVTGIAARLGIEVVPLPMDANGLRADGIVRAHRRHALRAIYVQPTLHNPLGMTMPLRRRAELVRVLDGARHRRHRGSRLRVSGRRSVAARVARAGSRRHDRQPVETRRAGRDAGLCAGAAGAGRRDCRIDQGRARLLPSGLALEIGVRWLADGTVASLVRDKRRDAVRRQKILRRQCPALKIRRIRAPTTRGWSCRPRGDRNPSRPPRPNAASRWLRRRRLPPAPATRRTR